MTKYFYKGGAFDRTLASGRSVPAWFDRNGILHATSDGTTWGSIPLAQVEHTTAAKTLTPAENGKTILYANLASEVITLPLASKGKMKFTISVHALTTSGAGAKVSPNAADLILGCGLTGTAGQSLQLTAATDVLGDFVELVSNGVTTWHLTRKVGIWVLV